MSLNIIIPHAANPTHLAEVTDEMQSLGAPVIRAFWSEAYGAFVAVEGSHRVVAAHRLGLIPEVEEIEMVEDAPVSEFGPDIDCDLTCGEWVERAHRRPLIAFAD